MIDKIVASVADALADVKDGSTVLVGGFGGAGMPNELIDGLIAQGAKDLTIVANNAGSGEEGLAALLKAGQVRKIICSFPRQSDSYVFDRLYRSGKLELELVPQGNLAERIRAAGAGIGAFFSPTGYGTQLAGDRETREICVQAVRRFEAMGATVEEACPELGAIADAFMVLRAQSYVVDRELQLASHRDLIKADIVWNTEMGLKATPSRLAWADRERALFYRRVADFFATFDVLVTPGASTPAFDVTRRMPEAIDGRPLEHYLGGSLITAIPTLMGTPSLAVPCGFDHFGRPVGLQIVGPPRGESSILAAAALFEQASGLDRLLPILPRAGTVPVV